MFNSCVQCEVQNWTHYRADKKTQAIPGKGTLFKMVNGRGASLPSWLSLLSEGSVIESFIARCAASIWLFHKKKVLWFHADFNHFHSVWHLQRGLMLRKLSGSGLCFPATLRDSCRGREQPSSGVGAGPCILGCKCTLTTGILHFSAGASRGVPWFVQQGSVSNHIAFACSKQTGGPLVGIIPRGVRLFGNTSSTNCVWRSFAKSEAGWVGFSSPFLLRYPVDKVQQVLVVFCYSAILILIQSPSVCVCWVCCHSYFVCLLTATEGSAPLCRFLLFIYMDEYILF